MEDTDKRPSSDRHCKKCNAELASEWSVCPFCGRAVNYAPTPKKRGNGQGTAYKRGNTWTGIRPGYRYLADGENGEKIYKRKRPSKGGFKTKKEALSWASNDDDVIVVPKLSELWTMYSENAMTKLGKDKQTAYKIARKRLEPVISRKIDTLTVEDLQTVINEQCKSYYTAKDVRDLLSNLYKLAMASNHPAVNQNISRHLVLPDHDEHESVPFTEEELKAIWKTYEAGDVIAGFTLLMIYTGMMPGELLKLKKDMIDLGSMEIRGAGAKTKVRKKAVIVFPSFICPVIESLMNYDPQSDRLYPVTETRFYEQYYASLERAGTRKLPPYSCRHTYGTEIVKAGLHPAMVQKLLRHSNQKTQEKYTHLSAADEHDAISMVDKWLTS